MAARVLIPAVLLAVLAAVPFTAPASVLLFTLALAKGLAVLGIVVLLRAGQVSFGHALYFGASAYAVAFAARAMQGGSVSLLLLAGVAAAVVTGIVVGLFVVRYRYIFFGMLNLAFSMVLYSVLEKFFFITGGSDGLRVPRPTLFGMAVERFEYETTLFYLTLALVVLCAWLVYRYFQSPLGEALRALKSNETRLEYIGLSARGVLLVAYVISAALAGLGGTLLALVQGHVTPELSYWVRSGEFVFIAILGGAGSVVGPFVGAIVYELVRAYASAFAADVWQMILGGFLLVIILFASRGLVGMYQDVEERLFSRRVVTGGRRRPV
ncbi:branched-chain amino acid ABC transporter permease [Azospirillum sp.]|uniref:branched-chain amino acid ABC transporter permease n=1 Tax=Azospirillum sp. TaxID=34012 RepID=UPI002D71B5CD|nr:branched-chain amino acid ABC transporter permease [Azospirillum sp.]HYD68544.1 branched-chain amino acid ABC transporter permease [Azospirillum sp.]